MLDLGLYTAYIAILLALLILLGFAIVNIVKRIQDKRFGTEYMLGSIFLGLGLLCLLFSYKSKLPLTEIIVDSLLRLLYVFVSLAVVGFLASEIVRWIRDKRF